MITVPIVILKGVTQKWTKGGYMPFLQMAELRPKESE